MIINIHLNGAELSKYQEFLDKSAQDDNEYAPVYKMLSDQMREECKPGFIGNSNDGVVRTTATINEYGALDLEIGYDVETTLKIMELCVEHRETFTRISEFVSAGIRMISGFSNLWKKTMGIIETRKQEYAQETAPITGTNN